MNTKQIKANAKEKLKGKFGSLLLISIFVNVLTAISNVLPVIGMFLTRGPIQLSYHKILKESSESYEAPRWQSLFTNTWDYFKNQWGQVFYLQLSSALYCWPVYLVVFVGFILGSIITAIGIAVSYGYRGYQIATTLGSFVVVISFIVSIVLSVVLYTRTKMGYYIMIHENGLDGKEARDKSIALMKGHEWEYVWFRLSMILYFLINVFFNYGMPMISLSTYDYFDAIYNEKPEVKPICPSCGNQLEKDAKFCNKCGTKVSD